MDFDGFKRLRWIWVATFSLLVFALLAGTIYVAKWQSTDRPLQAGLSKLAYVRGVHLEQDGRELVVKISLGEVSDLAAAYGEMESLVAAAWRGKPYRLVLHDTRGAELTALWRETQFAVYEAVQTGGYIAMVRAIGEAAVSRGIRTSLAMDARYLYVHYQKDSYHLCEVIPRGEEKGR
ncbi:MAG: hypothetical protein AB1331_01840 [Bacillota bacterium]